MRKETTGKVIKASLRTSGGARVGDWQPVRKPRPLQTKGYAYQNGEVSQDDYREVVTLEIQTSDPREVERASKWLLVAQAWMIYRAASTKKAG